MTSMRDSLRFMLPVCGVLAVLAAVVGYLVHGGSGALGAAAGVALMTVLFMLSTLIITWVDSVNRPMVLPAGMLVYGGKLAVVLLTLSALSGWAGLKPMAFGIVAGALGWAIGYAWWVWHAKITLDV